ncbi:MAG: DNA/RNA helicase domain-containing protein, partial [Candidatus Marinimicrobia bacterium]|nr:DNA/RNA helicase domain-containing protein [Candidatus Neomarinimicrobiota bacterium]
YPKSRSKMDASIRGYKTLLKNDPEKGEAKIKSIILNTYKTLMTRGMKGCYVYCTDKETAEYFKSFF